MDELRPDIEVAKRAMSNRSGAGREIKRLTNYLWEYEQVRLMASGTYGPGTGLMVITDRRLLFVKDGITSQTSEDVLLERITSVQWSAGMTAGTLTVFASGNRVEIKNLNKADGKRMAETLRAITSGITGPDTVGPARPPEASPHAAPYVPHPPLQHPEVPMLHPEIPTTYGDPQYGRAALPVGSPHQEAYYPQIGRHDAGHQNRFHESGYGQESEFSRGYQHDYRPDPPTSWTQPITGVPVSPAVGPWDTRGRAPDAYDLLRMVDTLHAAGILSDQEAVVKRAFLLDRR